MSDLWVVRVRIDGRWEHFESCEHEETAKGLRDGLIATGKDAEVTRYGPVAPLREALREAMQWAHRLDSRHMQTVAFDYAKLDEWFAAARAALERGEG